MGSGENAIASGLLAMESTFGFLDWMSYGLPLVLILLPLSWFLLQRSIRVPDITIDTRPAMVELVRLGSLKGPEREILVVLAVSVTFWIAGKAIEDLLNLPPTLLSSAVVAIGAVAVLSIEEVIDWNDLKGVNWGVFFCDRRRTDTWRCHEQDRRQRMVCQPALAHAPRAALCGHPGALVLMAFVLTQFMNNVTLGAILAPILITLGTASGIEPARLVVPTVMTLALAYMLPSASARMTLVAVTGAVERKDMIRAGLVVGVPSMIVIYCFFYLMSILGVI
ncbi:MAG: hypothetical protein HC802_08735 [Caldilineaceae bacterium]|nr:hypothetical protein [Caldilineaceae bacterium]